MSMTMYNRQLIMEAFSGSMAARCKATVSGGTGWHFYQCKNKNIKDGYCRVHHPDERRARSIRRGDDMRGAK